ncbi:MAG: von Willebrand factor type A domain-containing protein, partial [Opitutaceae bacterium]|nr:von Willebrand factor type A domain-containing protein [Opitutaceae bacterium]
MNHDDINPKSGPAPDMEPWIEPELEARVVAWVAGEASPFEIAELERLLTEKPELAVFKRRIEAVQGLVADAAAPDREPLQLSGPRRAQLLQTLGGGVAATDPTTPFAPTEKPRPWSWRAPQLYFTLSGLAAACIVAMMTIAWDREERVARPDQARMLELALPSVEEVRAQSGAALKRRVEVRDGAEPDEAPPMAVQFAPARPAPPAPPALPIGQAGEVRSARAPAGGAAFERGVVGGATPSPPMRDDAIVKLEPFVVAETMTGNGAALASASVVAAPKPGKLTLNAPGSTFGFGTNKPAAGSVTLGATAGSVTFGEKAKDLDAKTVSDAFSGQTLAKTDAARGEFRFVPAESKATVASRSDAPTARPGSAAVSDDALRAEITAATQPESTFSLHVGDVSFRLAHAALRRGEKPDAARIRPEEFYNAFDYGDPAPTMAEKIGARVEQAAHPFLQQRNLVRIALRVPTTGRGASQPLRLTVLLDTSGSMEREDRAASVQRALQALIALLGPNDRITLIGFARQPRLLAEAVAGNQAGWLVEAAARTPAEGGTNLEAALQLGGELARRHQAPGAQNRVILLTDGAANLGSADPAQLATAIETLRRQGLAFDACGVGLEGLDDAVLEALTRKGDGRYYVLNSPDDADAGFAQKLAGALRPAAENVKLQVRFNPARTGRYRLIG